MSEQISTLLIAAGGRGTRMGALSEDKPKHLVEVAGKPLLNYSLRAAEQAGFTRVVLLVEYKAEMIEAFVKNEFGDSKIEIVFVRQSEQVGDKYGTAAVIEAVESNIGREPFVAHNGDGLFTVEALKASRVNDGLYHVFVQETQGTSPLAIVEIGEDDMMQGIGVEDGANVPPLMNTALNTFQPEIFAAVKSVEESPRGEYEVTDALNVLCAENKVKAHVLDNQWTELTSPEDIPTVEDFIHKHFNG